MQLNKMGLYLRLPALCLISLCTLALVSGSSELLKRLQNDIPAVAAEPVTSKPLAVHLSEHPACAKDLAALATRCQLSPEEMRNDFAALVCVQQRPPEQFEAITETCEQVLWTFKNELTKGGKFIQQVEDVSNSSCIM